uniref:GOLD domain-containing protein n=1 Tax=Aplanochytrium stocchinoi TaxID=215587 RepID=A0A7S3PLE2_9STRA
MERLHHRQQAAEKKAVPTPEKNENATQKQVNDRVVGDSKSEGKRSAKGSLLWRRRRRRSHKKSEGYYVVLKHCNEGDIVLYYTKQYVAKLQRFVTRSRYDHIGILVIWENCSEECCPATLKHSRRAAGIKAWHTLEADNNGVTLYRFTPALLSGYNGTCYIRHLKLDEAEFSLEVREDMLKSLHAFTEEMYGRPYEKHVLEMIKAANMFGGNKKEDLSSVFCSELVAAAYRRMGLLSEGRTSNSYIPGDFSSQAKPKRQIKLLHGAELEEEFYIDCENLFLETEASDTAANFDSNDKIGEKQLQRFKSSRKQTKALEIDRILHEVECLAELPVTQSIPNIRCDNSTQLLRQAKTLRETNNEDAQDSRLNDTYEDDVTFAEESDQNAKRDQFSDFQRIITSEYLKGQSKRGLEFHLRKGSSRTDINVHDIEPISLNQLAQLNVDVQKLLKRIPDADEDDSDLHETVENINNNEEMTKDTKLTASLSILPGDIGIQLIYVEDTMIESSEPCTLKYHFRLVDTDDKNHDILFAIIGPIPHTLVDQGLLEKCKEQQEARVRLYGESPRMIHERSGAREELVSGEVLLDKSGWYSLCWDNTYSWLTSKTVAFMAKVE